MKKKILLAVLASIIGYNTLSVQAVTLPSDLQQYLHANTTGVSIRFDGLINMTDGTMYIPIVPAMPQEVSKLEVVYTYPKGMKINDRPDVITFNNNYSLLKVINDGKKKTVTSYNNLPEVVKTGILPQDMLVPTGFYVSENMRGLLGDLEIPVSETSIHRQILTDEKSTDLNAEKTVTNSKNGKKIVKTHKKVLKVKVPNELNDKMFLVSNYDSQYLKVFTPGRPEPIYGLKLKGILKDVKVTPDKKYLMTAVFGKNEVDVADIGNEQIAKTLELQMQPSEIVIDDFTNKAYVLCSEGKSIFIINLEDMTITEKITLTTIPYRMTLSPDGTQIAYGDKSSDKIFVLKLDDEYKNVPITECENISKIIIDNDNRLYALSRTHNSLIVNDYNLSKPFVTGEESEDKLSLLQNKLTRNTRRMLGAGDFLPQNAESDNNEEIEELNATVEQQIITTGRKPTEMFLYNNKLFIVCSGDNKIDVFDTETLKFTAKIDIPFKGFPRKMTRIENSNLAILTDANAKQYAVINLDTNKIESTYPIDMPVNSITIINKINNINLIEQSL